MNKKVVIGVVGSWSAKDYEMESAEKLGALIASEGWVTLSGGQPSGIMEAVSKGASQAGGLVIGVLPSAANTGDNFSEYVHIPVFTGMGHARNYVNVQSSDVVVVASNLSNGTNSEVAAATTLGKHIVLMSKDMGDRDFYLNKSPEKVHIAESSEEVIEIIKNII